MTVTQNEMDTVVVKGGLGPATALELRRMPVPVPKAGEVLIRVRAAGVNRPDVFQRMGLYPPPPGAPETLGLEVAGEIVEPCGRWRVGDRVCALLGGGGYAQFAVCDGRHVLPVPEPLTFVEAAGLPETVITVYANVFEHGALKPGETLMVHGATSGIGWTAIQMGKAAGARVIATARSPAKANTARSAGADIVVDTSVQKFAEVALADGGVDVVLDMVGGQYFDQNLSALRQGGRIVFIATLGGGEVTLPVLQLMQKRAVLTGSTLRGRSADEKARLTRKIEQVVWPWLSNGRLVPRVDREFRLGEAAGAHLYLEANDHVGKVVLTTE